MDEKKSYTKFGRLIVAGCESTDVATDKAVADEIIMKWERPSIGDGMSYHVVIINRLVGREWSQVISYLQ